MTDHVSNGDLYETLQVAKTADPETIQRVFRLLAQRYHPDNAVTGNADRFREIHAAYVVLIDPEQRAKYDLKYEAIHQERWRTVARATPDETTFELERHLRTVVMEICYSQRRTQPDRPGISALDVMALTGMPREQLEFALWYLVQKRLLVRDDQSNLTITADGVDFVEESKARIERRLLG